MKYLIFCFVLFFACVQDSVKIPDNDITIDILSTDSLYTMIVHTKVDSLDELTMHSNLYSLVERRPTDTVLLNLFETTTGTQFIQAQANKVVQNFEGDWLLSGQSISDTIGISRGVTDLGMVSFSPPNILVIPYIDEALIFKFVDEEFSATYKNEKVSLIKL